MRLGILSDTHGKLDAMIAAMRTLRNAGAEYYIHCGDVGGEAILDELAGLTSAFVFGNNDYDRRELARYSASIDVRCLREFGELELNGKRIAVTHGDDARLVKQLMLQQRHDYLLLGHTHVKRDQRSGTMRVINPGALYRAAEKTVAVLDLPSDELKFLLVAT